MHYYGNEDGADEKYGEEAEQEAQEETGNEDDEDDDVTSLRPTGAASSPAVGCSPALSISSAMGSSSVAIASDLNGVLKNVTKAQLRGTLQHTCKVNPIAMRLAREALVEQLPGQPSFLKWTAPETWKNCKEQYVVAGSGKRSRRYHPDR